MNDDDGLVAEYLGRLVQAARPLPPDRRAELVDEIADHIDQARASSAASGQALRDVLQRLGEPEAIVAAASDAAGDFQGPFTQPVAAVTQPSAPRRQRRLDRAAVLLVLASVLLIPINFVLALLGWVVGIVLLLLSPRWPNRAKVLGAVTGTLTFLLYGGLLYTLVKAWNSVWDTRALGWRMGVGPFLSSITVTAVVVVVTLIAVKLLRYPLPQAAAARPAMPEGPEPAAQPPATAREPAEPAPAR